MLSEAGKLLGQGRPLSKGWGSPCHQAPEKLSHKLHIGGGACPELYLCSISRPWLLPQFLCHIGASEFDKAHHQAGASPSSQNPGLSRRRRLPQAFNPLSQPSLWSSLCILALYAPPALPTPALPSLRKDMLPGQGLQQTLHLGLKSHYGFTSTGVFLCSGEKKEGGPC